MAEQQPHDDIFTDPASGITYICGHDGQWTQFDPSAAHPFVHVPANHLFVLDLYFPSCQVLVHSLTITPLPGPSNGAPSSANSLQVSPWHFIEKLPTQLRKFT